MKQIITLILLLSLLFLSSCNNGITKVKYNILETGSSSEISSSDNSETASTYVVEGDKVIIDDKVTYGYGSFNVYQSSKSKESSGTLPYNPNEELIFDDNVLKQIIIKNLNDQLGGETYTNRVTVGDCVDLKIDKLEITQTFKSASDYSITSKGRFSLNTDSWGGLISFGKKRITSLNVLSQVYSLKIFKLIYQNSSQIDDNPYVTPIEIDISPLFKQKVIEELTINVNNGPAPFTLKGLNAIANCNSLKSVELINCGITDGSPLLYLNPKVLKVLKYGGNPIASDENFNKLIKEKYPLLQK